MQSSAAEKQTETRPVGDATGPYESNSKRPYNSRSYRGDEDGEQRPRGGRGTYRGNKPWDPSRGGRGAYRGNQDRNSNYRDSYRNNNQESESSDAMYTQRPGGNRGGSSYRGDRGNYRGNSNYRDIGSRGGRPNYPNSRWEQAQADEGGAAQNQEVIELELNDAQHEIYNRKLAYVRQNMRGIVDEDDFARICHQCNFDENEIEQKLNSYQTDSKYSGLKEYEWQTTQTRQEKDAAKRRKFEQQERKRLQQARQKELEEKRLAREKKQAEQAALKAQRLAEKEERQRKRAEERAEREAKAAKRLEKEANEAVNQTEGEDQNEVQPQNDEEEVKTTEAPVEETTPEPTAVEGAQSMPEAADQETSGNVEEKPSKSERKPKEKREKRPRTGRGKKDTNQMVYRAKEQVADQVPQDSVDASQAKDQEPEEQEDAYQAKAQADAIANQVLDTQESAKVDDAEEEENNAIADQQSAQKVKQAAAKQDQADADNQPAAPDQNAALLNYIRMMQGGQMPGMSPQQVPGQPALSPEQQNLVNQSIMLWQQQQIQMLQQQFLQQQMLMQGGQLPAGAAAGQPPMSFQPAMPFNMGNMGYGPPAGKK